MTRFALGYLVWRVVFRVLDFFHHWYGDASRRIAHTALSTLEGLDRTFALRMTLRHFFVPLYKDYTIVGRILGIIFRTGRTLVALAVYLVIAFIFFVLYVVWLLIPPLTIVYATRGYR